LSGTDTECHCIRLIEDYPISVNPPKIFESLMPAERQQQSLAEMQRFYDGRHVNYAAQIIIATGLRG
jgi:hypothetical protein